MVQAVIIIYKMFNYEQGIWNWNQKIKSVIIKKGVKQLTLHVYVA